MKNLITLASVAFCTVIVTSCSKNSDYAAGTDHTSGMTTGKRWSGHTDGNCKMDTSYVDATTHNTEHKTKLKPFSRIITDSVFALEKYNDFTIKALGNWMRYRSTDSATHIVKYDTTYPGSAKSFINFNYSDGSVDMEIHKLYEQDAETGNFFQEHWYLHTTN